MLPFNRLFNSGGNVRAVGFHAICTVQARAGTYSHEVMRICTLIEWEMPPRFQESVTLFIM